MAVLYTNNAVSALSASITSTATSFSVTSGHGVKFPTVSGADYFYVTLYDNAGNIEIVKVTGRSTDTFTVVRGQDGTTGLAFSAADKVELRVTKAVLDDIKTDTKSSLSSGNVTTALGFTPYNATNPNGYITGITSGNVTTALGFTPYNATNPSGYITSSGSETLTNKRINPRFLTNPAGNPFTPDISQYDQFNWTALSSLLSIAAPSGTPVNGNKIMFRFTPSGTPGISWNATYTAIGVTLPTTTVSGKTVYVGCIYNADLTRWDVIAVATQA